MKLLIGVMLLLAFAVTANAQTYNCKITTQTEFGATTISTQALAAHSNRRCLTIQNKGASTVYIKFGSASTGTDGIAITAGGNWEPFIVPINALFIRSATGASTTTTLVLEGK